MDLDDIEREILATLNAVRDGMQTHDPDLLKRLTLIWHALRSDERKHMVRVIKDFHERAHEADGAPMEYQRFIADLLLEAATVAEQDNPARAAIAKAMRLTGGNKLADRDRAIALDIEWRRRQHEGRGDIAMAINEYLENRRCDMDAPALRKIYNANRKWAQQAWDDSLS